MQIATSTELTALEQKFQFLLKHKSIDCIEIYKPNCQTIIIINI